MQPNALIKRYCSGLTWLVLLEKKHCFIVTFGEERSNVITTLYIDLMCNREVVEFPKKRDGTRSIENFGPDTLSAFLRQHRNLYIALADLVVMVICAALAFRMRHVNVMQSKKVMSEQAKSIAKPLGLA
ncbi:hypothetical protein NDU88_002778 [Pleurodeles waltl]|uniref:Uncharacterized protein n=1 Tax=Pleurodeles waltl TaxID=8319 RepID=A0AAV7WTC9_PLEWA|nr:hypothetical protein NDU88_002778 [Pleurodeles waltl]